MWEDEIKILNVLSANEVTNVSRIFPFIHPPMSSKRIKIALKRLHNFDILTYKGGWIVPKHKKFWKPMREIWLVLFNNGSISKSRLKQISQDFGVDVLNLLEILRQSSGIEETSEYFLLSAESSKKKIKSHQYVRVPKDLWDELVEFLQDLESLKNKRSGENEEPIKIQA